MAKQASKQEIIKNLLTRKRKLEGFFYDYKILQISRKIVLKKINFCFTTILSSV